MSHFTVLVLTKPNGKTVDELLAPYSEELEVAPYVYRTKEEIIENAKKNKSRILDRLKEKNETPNDWDKKYLNAETDEDFYLAERDDNCYEYDEKGNELSTYNPDSKWDWYSIGGRWAGLLRTFNGCCNSTLISDLNFEIDSEEYNKYLRFWEVVVDGDIIREDEDKEEFYNWYSKEWYIKTYHDKETYAKLSSSLSTYAVVTPDGVWHEKGKMGWWGISSETPEKALDWELHFKERFIDTAEPDWTATVVDCHI